MKPHRPFSMTLAATLVLGALATLWLLRGAFLYPAEGQDLEARWAEVQVLLEGTDPNMVSVVGEPPGRVVGVYPPWSYVIATPLHLPGSLDDARAVYAVVWALCLAGTCVLIGRRFARRDPSLVALAIAAFGAQTALMGDLRTGNYGLIVCAMLWGALDALDNGKPLRAGVLIGLASLKPSIALPFGLVLLLRRERWPAAAIALGIPLAGAAASWAITGVDPLTSFAASRSHDYWFVDRTGGVPEVLGNAAGGFSSALQSSWSALVLGLGAAGLWWLRASPPAAQFALLALVSTSWTYHRAYDYTVLSFALLWLIAWLGRAYGPDSPAGGDGAASDAALDARAAAPVRLALAWTAFAIVAATAWLPPRAWGHESGVFALTLAWMVAALALLALRPKPDPGRRPSGREAASGTGLRPPA